ncbi:MAG TPA: aminotransferase class V-fold PLP-dependent enzyme, partial [Longimicrobiales bacterium]|nr:aminotransferase class V-fold PLP-dependent enzyme [Longimicrobiales bacterium]
MTADPLARVRAREFPRAGEGVYLDTASCGLLPKSTVEAVDRLGRARTVPGGFTEKELGRALGRARSAAARLVGCRAEEISLAPNTSYGVNLAARLVASGSPGTIVVSHGEFPANVLPWKALEGEGFRVECVPTDRRGLPDEARLLERIRGDDVRAFALSAVQFASGYRTRLEPFGSLCRERGVLFVVDAIQALGAAPLDVKEAFVDVLACGGQKWLCSPWGSGFAFVDETLHDRFDPPMVSWLAMEDATDFGRLLEYRYRFAADGRKFELATLGIQDYAGLSRSAELLLEIGIGRIREHLLGIHEPLIRWLDSTDGAEAV